MSRKVHTATIDISSGQADGEKSNKSVLRSRYMGGGLVERSLRVFDAPERVRFVSGPVRDRAGRNRFSPAIDENPR